MILGAISFSNHTDRPSVLDNIRAWNSSENLFFQKASYGNFKGGYFLNTRLPYTPADFYYSDERNEIMVLVSGVVYNKPELVHHCNITEQVPAPELIAELFRHEGPGFIGKLNGDFIIFIYQQGKKQAYLFRDHVGIRPLAYATNSHTLWFSSDIIGLCRVFSDGQSIDSDYLLGYFKYIDYRKTPWEKVKKLLPGHFLHFSENGIEIKKYWQPEKIKVDKTLSHDKMLADLKSLLVDAVRIRCDHRFRAGAHVSSGIDSGVVSALARKEYAQQDTFYGFSWSPADYNHSDVKYDERELVRTLCMKTGISPLFSEMGTGNFPEIVSSFYDNHGFFSEGSTINHAVDFDTNLIFSGWGGDEFISTAAAAIEPDLLRRLKLCLYLRRNQIMQPKKFVKNVVYYVLMPALGILDRSTSRAFRDDARYLKKPFKKSDRKAVRLFYFQTSRRHHHLGMLNFYHLQDRCENWYVMGYRKGVEYRYPLLDKRIIEYMLKVPSEVLCKTNYFRPLLREVSERILPDEIRLNKSKNDPVYWFWMDELFRNSAVRFMEEVDEWKQNPDLHFVEFDLLAENIRKFKALPDSVDSKVLFRALVYLKAIHEFTLRYRELERI
jgi:asparagine synthase (glutamine-hydrolysing)